MAALPTHATTLERGDRFDGTAEHTACFELANHDRVVLNADLEFIAFVDVEQATGLGRYHDAAEVIDLANYHGIQRRTSISIGCRSTNRERVYRCAQVAQPFVSNLNPGRGATIARL